MNIRVPVVVALVVSLVFGCDDGDELALVDAGRVDAGRVDAGRVDAGRVDAAANEPALDASTPDVGTADTSPRAPDEGVARRDGTSAPPDVGATVDASPIDGMQPDAGPPQPLLCPGDDFAPCGGDPSGVWQLVDFCSPEGLASQFRDCEGPGEDEPACQALPNARRCGLLYRGTLEFGAIDQATFDVGVSVAVQYTLDDACLSALSPEPSSEAACEDIGNDRLVCLYTAGLCVCTAETPPESEQVVMPYAVDGSTLTIRGVDGTFCADGEHLRIRFDPFGPEGWRAWLLAR